jgi:hypothetical protein
MFRQAIGTLRKDAGKSTRKRISERKQGCFRVVSKYSERIRNASNPSATPIQNPFALGPVGFSPCPDGVCLLWARRSFDGFSMNSAAAPGGGVSRQPRNRFPRRQGAPNPPQDLPCLLFLLDPLRLPAKATTPCDRRFVPLPPASPDAGGPNPADGRTSAHFVVSFAEPRRRPSWANRRNLATEALP